MSSPLEANLAAVHAQVRMAAERVGRSPDEVAIVAVTKTFPVERVREAMSLGLRAFGENRVQEAISKIDEIGTTDASWHLIGHLQSNKVRFIEGRFAMVQSIDRVGLVDALDRRLEQTLDVLVEVNVAGEAQKTGAAPSDVVAIVEAIERAAHLRLQGLMTIAPMVPDASAVRPVFRQLRQIRDETGNRLGRALAVLSMGMTGDYAVAIEEGSTMLRLGRALFGPR
ncbi:MAG TPA: YggS family pyridoxal phosphate-dependent enzyme [Candidatus Dormibacteraeota bacterium]